MTDKVDPRYLTTPIDELIKTFGWEWVRRQEEIFGKVLKGGGYERGIPTRTL